MTFKFPGIATAAARVAQGTARAELQNWLNANRELLIARIRKDTNAAAQMLRLLCVHYPAVEKPIEFVMKAETPDKALNLLAMFDAQLAERLRAHPFKVARLQEVWRASEKRNAE